VKKTGGKGLRQYKHRDAEGQELTRGHGARVAPGSVKAAFLLWDSSRVLSCVCLGVLSHRVGIEYVWRTCEMGCGQDIGGEVGI